MPYISRTRNAGLRLIAIVLVLNLLSTSTPAAPQIVVSFAKEESTLIEFWYYSGGLRNLLQGHARSAAPPQETQTDRDAKVARLEIHLGNVTIDLGERIRFVALPYDAAGNPVGGLKINWSAQMGASHQRIHLSPQGEFQSILPGVFTVTAQAANQSAQVVVTVQPGLKPNLSLPPLDTRQVSSRDLPPTAVGSTKGQKNSPTSSAKADQRSAVAALTKRAHARRPVVPVPMQSGGGGWNDTNYWAASKPENRVGNPPGMTMDGGAGSANFQFAAPIYDAPGRGINISLALMYNSRVWNKANTQISYDNDRGWPSPGFNLGFGKLLGIGVYTGCMLVDADGTRHSYAGNITIYNWGTYGVMHTTDGSLIDYTYETGTNGVMLWAQAKLPNGTLITYGAYSQPGGGLFPTSIEDADGNVINITYLNNAGPRIQTVTDTLGRAINFYYDYNNLLTAITAAGLSGGTRTLARLHYHQISLGYSFSYPDIQSTVVPNPYPWVLDAIYYPATSTGYWLNDSDSYSSYGMLAKVIEQRGMSFSATSLNDMGTVGQGSLTQKEVRNYPLYVGDTSGTQSSNLTDAPTFTTSTQSWTRDGTNLDSATTTYSVNENATPRTVQITLPNGTTSKQYSFNAPGQWNDGLIYHDVTFVSDENSPLQSSDSTWEQGAYSSPRPTRIQKTDERGQVTAVGFSYGSVYNQVTELRDYDYGGTALLRATRTTYQNSSNYTNRHIFNLPLTVEIYAGDAVTRVSRTEYQYDGQPLTAAPYVVMHDQAANPHADEEGYCYWDNDWNDPDCTGNCYDYSCDGYCSQIWICPYDGSTDYRGHVTQITTYADAASLTGPVTETRGYDVTGNLVKTSTSCCDQTSFNYTVDTQYAYPQSQTRGSATDWHAQVTTSATYDFNTGLGLSGTDANGRVSTTTYAPDTLRMTSAIAATGAHTDYAYDESQMKVTTTTYLSTGEGGGITDQNVKLLNGLGQVRQEQALGANGVWDLVDTVYDNMGQISQQSRPYRSGDTQQWKVMTYDALGRAKTVTAADGSMGQTFYNEPSRPDVASNLPGETRRVQDPWGRERWTRTDASGHLVEVVEPIFWGTGSVSAGMQTTYSYNTLGNLTQIVQGQQTRTFKYDSLGRLLAQKLAERNATLNDAGSYVGSGTWSDVFTYDDRSNLTSRTDARGVKMVYTYNSDPLNRLQSVSWDTTGFGDTTHPILAAAAISYQYRQKVNAGDLTDVTQLQSVNTAGVSTESYGFDTEGRVNTKTLTLNSRPNNPFATDYTFDSLDRTSLVLYPKEYGNGSALRKLVQQTYDVASRLSSLTFDGQTQASNIVYNAASQATSLTVGTGTNQVSENYGFNAQTGLLETQTLTRNGSTLLNLSYDYTGANGKRTGQLTKITNNLDNTKNRTFEYDPLGRLIRATGGQTVTWAQRYDYDRYGNRGDAFSYTADSYIRNFYQNGLNRQPTSTEFNSWLSTLQTAYAQGQSQFLAAMQSLGQSIFNSQEYANRNRSDHDFVYDLYKTYLYREPDSGGWAYWESQVPLNGRSNIRLAFDVAPEFSYKVGGTSPYTPSGGTAIPADGLQQITYDPTSNRINNVGWSYDAAGNQTTVVHSGGAVEKFQYDAANRLVVVKDGNDVQLASYTYGSSNERLIAQEGSTTTFYVGESGTNIAEYVDISGNPTWSKSYVYLGHRLLSTLVPNGSGGDAVEYDHPDRLGTRVTTNPSTGGWSEQVTLPYGTALATESSGTPTKRRFTSYDRSDATGLDNAVNRQYDPQQGRFTQADPAGMKFANLGAPQTLNLYAYCGNDPVNRFDPSGLGFLSFLSKLFKVVQKILKWVVIAAMVATAVISTIGLIIGPFALHTFLTTTLLGKILGFVSSIPLRIGNFIAGLGKTIAGVFTFAETGAASARVAEMIGYGALMGGSEAAGAISRHLQQQDKRPPKVPVLIIESPKRPKTKEERHKECVDHEWEVFNQEVEKVKEEIEDAYHRNELLQILADVAGSIGQWGKIGPDEKVPDNPGEGVYNPGPDIALALKKQKDIEDATKKAEASRDQRIKDNCK